MKWLTLPLCALFLISACNSTTNPPPATAAAASPVRVSDAASVAQCQFLSSVTESRYSGMLFAGSGLQKAQQKVLATAAGMGATHVVWGALNAGGAVQTATGSAYRCT